MLEIKLSLRNDRLPGHKANWHCMQPKVMILSSRREVFSGIEVHNISLERTAKDNSSSQGPLSSIRSGCHSFVCRGNRRKRVRSVSTVSNAPSSRSDSICLSAVMTCKAIASGLTLAPGFVRHWASRRASQKGLGQSPDRG